MLKPDWPAPRPDDPDAPFGPNGPIIEACLDRARWFTRSELGRLDIQERRDSDLLLAGWDHIRDRLGDDRRQAWLSAVRTASYVAVGDAARRLGLVPPADDGYWRVTVGPGYGAARVTRFVAAALIEPAVLDPEWFDTILEPWRDVIGDPAAPGTTS